MHGTQNIIPVLFIGVKKKTSVDRSINSRAWHGEHGSW